MHKRTEGRSFMSTTKTKPNQAHNGTHRRVLRNSIQEFYAAVQPLVPHLMIRYVLQVPLISPSPYQKRRGQERRTHLGDRLPQVFPLLFIFRSSPGGALLQYHKCKWEIPTVLVWHSNNPRVCDSRVSKKMSL
jgi:hypothetical protein